MKSGLEAMPLFLLFRRSVKYLPTKLFIAINTIEVGVDIFSLILKSRLRIEKEQISTPLPVTKVIIEKSRELSLLEQDTIENVS